METIDDNIISHILSFIDWRYHPLIACVSKVFYMCVMKRSNVVGRMIRYVNDEQYNSRSCARIVICMKKSALEQDENVLLLLLNPLIKVMKSVPTIELDKLCIVLSVNGFFGYSMHIRSKMSMLGMNEKSTTSIPTLLSYARIFVHDLSIVGSLIVTISSHYCDENGKHEISSRSEYKLLLKKVAITDNVYVAKMILDVHERQSVFYLPNRHTCTLRLLKMSLKHSKCGPNVMKLINDMISCEFV